MWVALIVAVAVAFFFKKDDMSYRSVSGMVWHTSYNIKYESAGDLGDSVIAVTNAIDMSASMYNRNSVISMINSNATDVADPMVAHLLERSQVISRETYGAFDPTVAPLMRLWKTQVDSAALPADEVVDSVMQYVGIGKVRLDGRRVVKSDSRVQLDFSAIAKGYGCDEVARMFERNGVENYIIEIGGEVVAHGKNERGMPWTVSVDMPIEAVDTVAHSSAMLLQLDSGAVATSGNYRNFKLVDGKKVAHIIDPATGRPALSNLLSVTVVAHDCIDADAYATALMVMGYERACKFASSRDDLGVVLIYATPEGKLQSWCNRGVERYVARQ